jgi:hypothetical protein
MTTDDYSTHALNVAKDGLRRTIDLQDVMTAIAAASKLSIEALEQIEKDLLRITDIIGGKHPQ